MFSSDLQCIRGTKMFCVTFNGLYGLIFFNHKNQYGRSKGCDFSSQTSQNLKQRFFSLFVSHLVNTEIISLFVSCMILSVFPLSDRYTAGHRSSELVHVGKHVVLWIHVILYILVYLDWATSVFCPKFV